MIQAKALICDEHQHFSIEDVVLPEPSPEHIVARTLYSGVSIGTEFALVRNTISWGPYPLCTGYQGVGVVEHVGSEVDGFNVGDTIYYRGNLAMEFPDGGSAVSSVGGTHCSMATIAPHTIHGAARLPVGVEPDVGSLFVMPAVGLHGVDMCNPRMGQTVLVYGVGLVGLGVVGACTHRGCVVIAVDLAANRLQTAKKLGADHVIDASTEDVKAAVEALTAGGADVVFESTGIPACIDDAIALCRQRGTFVWQGNYGAEPLSMHFLPAHARQLTMFFPCDDGMARCRHAVLKNIAMGALAWQHTISHRVEAAAAPELYDAINKGDAADVIGAVICWSSA